MEFLKVVNPVWIGWVLLLVEAMHGLGRAFSPHFVSAEALHIRGEFDVDDDFFLLLTKFGFQKTDLVAREETQGFIYGNVTARYHPSARGEGHVDSHIGPMGFATLAVLDKGYFLEFYGNRSLLDKEKACSRMFNKVNAIAYDSTCNDNGEEDFFRLVPCPLEKTCVDEDNLANVIPGYQFTYRIQDLLQSRFWYVSLVSCVRNKSTCEWQPTKKDFKVTYDIHLVNGDPWGKSRKNLFTFEFSYDNHDLLPVYLLLLLVYAVLTPVQLYAVTQQRHPITRLLAAGLTSEFIALLFTSFHFSLFAFNGYGVPWLSTFGDVMEIVSQSLFMLLLLLLAMGWAITRQELRCKLTLFTLWLIYTAVHCLLYVWKKVEVDVVDDIEEYQTVPGMIILVLRVLLILCFLIALRHTMLHEYNEEKLQFFLHFGAASLVWFVYLPIVALVALKISALWRTKFLTGIIYSADTFAYVVVVHLLWPSRSEQYFLLAKLDDNFEELEELSQSANNLHDQNLLESNLVDLSSFTEKKNHKLINEK